MRLSTASSTTIYPNDYYSVGSTTIKHIMALGEPIATIENATTTYLHADHLGSISATTNAAGDVVQVLDYYPYGAKRISSGTDVSQREFIGQEFDESTNLSYLNARYYNGAQGQFLSQDPLFWSNNIPMELLMDPQQMNSYSYARNNPINRSDPSGLGLKETLTGIIKQAISIATNMLKMLTSSKSTSNTSVTATNNTQQTTPTQPTQKTTTWDPVTDKRIKQLDPRVRQPATNFVNNTESELGVQLRVTDGYRTNEEQEKLYWQSRTNPPTGPWATNARGGESNHNSGRAIDVTVMENGKAYAKPITADIVDVGKQQGFEWGGDWADAYDPPHFEMYFNE